MASVKTSNPSKATATPKPAIATIVDPPAPADIDRLGLLLARIAVHEARIAADTAEAKALTEKLQKHYDEADPQSLPTADGATYVLLLSQKQEQQALVEGANQKIFKWLGKDTFLALADIGFGVLKSVLKDDKKYEEVVTKARTGRRTLKVLPKSDELPKAA